MSENGLFDMIITLLLSIYVNICELKVVCFHFTASNDPKLSGHINYSICMEKSSKSSGNNKYSNKQQSLIRSGSACAWCMTI